MSPIALSPGAKPLIHVPGKGPNPSPLCLVGEAPGLNEAIYGIPFIGEAGEELNRMLEEAGLDRKSLYVTNTFKHHPPHNDLSHFFTKQPGPAPTHSAPKHPHGHLRPELQPSFDSLIGELVGVGAKVVVALGATALWALLGQTKISNFAGTAHPPTPTRPFWLVPTYHPAAVLRQWSYRSLVVAHLRKAAETLATKAGSVDFQPRSALSPTNIKINPTLQEVEAWAPKAHASPSMAVDIETLYEQVRTISFSLSASSAFVVPFWEPPGPSYWSTAAMEVRAWNAVRHALGGPGAKIFHNAAFDLQYLWRAHGIPVRGPIHDTMVAYHALEPELPKGLGDLAALYLNLPEWKTRREE